MQELLHNRCNNFLSYGPNTSNTFFRFLVDGVHVGFIRRDIWSRMEPFAESVLETCAGGDSVTFVRGLTCPAGRGEAVQAMMEAMREAKAFPSLSGWRNEKYNVYHTRTLLPLFQMERSACSLLGVQTFGCHINGIFEKDGTTFMWIAIRSATKQTFPGMLDNFAAGGLNCHQSALECAISECAEEAGVPRDFAAKNLKAAGAISNCFEDFRGVHPETGYVFDLHLPEDFVPKCIDGEVERFQCVRVDELVALVTDPNFKPNSAIVVIDFLVRHGHLTEASEGLDLPFAEIVQLLHTRHPFDA